VPLPTPAHATGRLSGKSVAGHSTRAPAAGTVACHRSWTRALEGAVSTPAPPTQPPAGGTTPPPPERRKREILGPTGLIVMVAVILAFTAVSIVIELVSNHGKSYTASVDVLEQVPSDPNEYQVVFHITNRGDRAGRPDVCEATLADLRGERVGTASVRLRTDIQPGQTLDELAIATAAARPINGQVTCRSLEPD
jgi:hypothetical protein